MTYEARDVYYYLDDYIIGEAVSEWMKGKAYWENELTNYDEEDRCRALVDKQGWEKLVDVVWQWFRKERLYRWGIATQQEYYQAHVDYYDQEYDIDDWFELIKPYFEKWLEKERYTYDKGYDY